MKIIVTCTRCNELIKNFEWPYDTEPTEDELIFCKKCMMEYEDDIDFNIEYEKQVKRDGYFYCANCRKKTVPIDDNYVFCESCTKEIERLNDKSEDEDYSLK